MQMKETLIKALREPRKAANVLMQRTLAPIGNRNYRPFVVLTRDRTGSNMLIQSLNSHPRIAADYEIFARLGDRDEQGVLAGCFSKQPFYISAKGFKIFYYHPQDRDHSPIWDMLAAVDGLHVIHLKRRNILHALVSSRIAYQTGTYGVRSDKEAQSYQNAVPTVHFTVEDLERDFAQTREWEQEAAARFSDKPILDVAYEDTATQLPEEFRRITDFLGVAPRLPRTDFKKQRIRPLSESVENYAELKAHFQGTQWEAFFDE